jgi:pyocin large subunit-like protein
MLFCSTQCIHSRASSKGWCEGLACTGQASGVGVRVGRSEDNEETRGTSMCGITGIGAALKWNMSRYWLWD